MRPLIIAAAIALTSTSAAGPAVMPALGELPSAFQLPSAAAGAPRLELARGTAADPRIVPPGLAAAWDALPAVYESLGLHGTVLNADARLFGVRQVRVGRTLAGSAISRYVRCGSDIMDHAGTLDVTLTVATVLEPSPQGIAVRSWVEATGRDLAGTGTAVHCVSTGLLESEIVRGLSQAAPAAPR